MVDTDTDFLTLQEAALILKKSVQTVRRLVKNGEIPAQQISTPQGFHYLIPKDILRNNQRPTHMNLQEEKVVLTTRNPDPTTQDENLTTQNPNPTSQTDSELPVLTTQNEIPTTQNLERILVGHFQEKQFLYRVLNQVQTELEYERRRPRSLFAYLAEWWTR
jgi:excisionase family DNA binding protein